MVDRLDAFRADSLRELNDGKAHRPKEALEEVSTRSTTLIIHGNAGSGYCAAS